MLSNVQRNLGFSLRQRQFAPGTGHLSFKKIARLLVSMTPVTFGRAAKPLLLSLILTHILQRR